MESFLERKSMEKNIKSLLSNKYESPESYSFSIHKKERAIPIDYFIKKSNKSNKKISTSSLPSNKKTYNKITIKNLKGNYLYHNEDKNLNNNISCPFLIYSSSSKTNNKIWNKNKNNYPNIYSNFNNNNYKKTKSMKKLYFDSKIGMKTFYKSGSSVESLLDKKIKLINKPLTSNSNSNHKKEKDKYDLESNYYYQKIFNSKLPLNELRYYKKILFNEKGGYHTSLQYFPYKEEKKVFSNPKINSTIKNFKINDNPHLLDIDNKNNDDNFETIELDGITTKVATKLIKNDSEIENKNEKEDFHKVMKHPFSSELFGYKFLNHMNNNYKIYKNPLDDKNLIKYIRNLIINPNTTKFRNYNLINNSKGFFRRKNGSVPHKNYKLLSKKGFERLKNDVINKNSKDIEDNFQRYEILKEKLDLIMERTKMKFQDHIEDVENREKK